MGSGRTTHASPEVRHRDSRKIRKDRWILSHPGEACLRCWDRKWSHIRRHRHQHMTHPSSRGTGLKTPQPSYSAAKNLRNLLKQWLCSFFSSLKVHLLFHVSEDFFLSKCDIFQSVLLRVCISYKHIWTRQLIWRADCKTYNGSFQNLKTAEKNLKDVLRWYGTTVGNDVD